MSALAINPELLRNTRIQLRRGRMLAVIVICAAVSLTFVAYYSLSNDSEARQQFQTIFLIQAAVLVLGGGIYCLQSVQREKDLNTFDFQRITRLTPFELAAGKVFGAPSLTYFVVLCLMPVALWAAVLGGTRVSTILKMYAILLVGAIAYHSFAVLISMVLDRGTSAGAMLFFLATVAMTSQDLGGSFQAGPLTIRAPSPFWAGELLSPNWGYVPPFVVGSPYFMSPGNDLFFGALVSHVGVLFVIYVTLTAWFWLAIVRNIKRDPSVYEIYRPAQGFALALYLNLLTLGFLRWMFVRYEYGQNGGIVSGEFLPISAADAEGTFLAISMAIFGFLGLALLRSRDRVRRQLRQLGSTAGGWWAAVWPAPLLVAGVSLAGAAIVGMIPFKLEYQREWSAGLGVHHAAFVAAWLARDFLYLQWMNLRPIRRPLVTGVLYLTIFYVCAAVLLAALQLLDQSRSVAAILLPSGVFGLDAPTWVADRPQWIGALALVFAQAFVFAWLQRRELQKLAAISPATGPAV